VRVKLLSITLALLLGAGIAACGGDDSSSGESAATPSPAETPTAAAAANVDQIVAGITKNTKQEPKVVTPQGDPPGRLVIKDIVKGKGPKAKPGDTLAMQYAGYSWSNGQKFDASWDRGGQPFPFKLGAGMVIPGWDKGMVGMQEGGRRLLIIPPDLGYGPAGSGPIAPNETLVFVVDLKKLK
jgi:peptidylprolyl isomerase